MCDGTEQIENDEPFLMRNEVTTDGKAVGNLYRTVYLFKRYLILRRDQPITYFENEIFAAFIFYDEETQIQSRSR